jgi:hypothetical protein
MPGTEDASAMFWRFLAFGDEDVAYVMSRDADSRFSPRETAAVGEWLESGKQFHLMRDHPAHNCAILGGMWGAETAPLRFLPAVIAGVPKGGSYGDDQRFLEKHVYPIARRDVMIHDSFFLRELTRRPFPTARIDLEFVGEVFDENERPRLSDRAVLARAERNALYRLRLRASSLVRRGWKCE